MRRGFEVLHEACPAALAVCLISCALTLSVGAQSTFFVSPNGDDSNDGLSAAFPWKTLVHVNSTPFPPGTAVLFQRGGEWRERLKPVSSGTALQPIVFDAYGDATSPKPVFWGSDVLSTSGFSLVSGTTSTYQIAFSSDVYSVFRNHGFLQSAYIINGRTGTASQLRAVVNANPDSWVWLSGILYVNTGGGHPTSTGQLWTATVRDDVVFADTLNYLVFRNLVADESARDDAGYAFRLQGSDHCRVEDCEAYRAGKHHFGVINCADFTGLRLFAGGGALPGQGFGGTSYLVSYSDSSRSNDQHQWIDCTVENSTYGYLGFYTHGEGMGKVIIQNAHMIGAELASDVSNLEVVGGLFEGLPESGSRCIVSLGASDSRIEGATLTGQAEIQLKGAGGHLAQNVLFDNVYPADSYGAFQIDAPNCIVRFNTIIVTDEYLAGTGALQLTGNAGGSKFYGNVFRHNTVRAGVRIFGSPSVEIDYNVYHPGPGLIFQLGNNSPITASAWLGLGYDAHSAIGEAAFRNYGSGDYALLPASPAVEMLATAAAPDPPAMDYSGAARLVGAAFDAGAFETQFPFVRMGAGGQFMLGHVLPVGDTYKVWRSLNLSNWTLIGTAENTPPSPDYHFTDDTTAITGGRVFYKFIKQEP